MLLVLVGDCCAHRPSAGWLPWTEFYGCLFPIVAATPGPLHAPPPARAQRGGGVPSRRHLASAVHVPFTLTRFCARDPVALVWSCQRSSLWLLSRHQREPLRRCWIDHPYGEEEITRLEDELLPAMESFLERIDVIDQQLREAQDRQVAQFELSGCRGCPPHHPPGRRASRDQRSAS